MTTRQWIADDGEEVRIAIMHTEGDDPTYLSTDPLTPGQRFNLAMDLLNTIRRRLNVFDLPSG
ncbi:MAG TPA: hypothetical protein VKA19_10590 [Alphaproteobacteria bacterium]|nr:hypothetical protein [Alphaproteobacteria bacterium]